MMRHIVLQKTTVLILMEENAGHYIAYTHIGFDDAEEELRRMEEFRKAQAEDENNFYLPRHFLPCSANPYKY